MNKKRGIILIILLNVLVFSVLGSAIYNLKEYYQHMASLTYGGESSYRYHLCGIVLEKTSDTLLVELIDKEESSHFFDTMTISLDCTKCKKDLKQVSEGDSIIFCFFKSNIDGETVTISEIMK